VSGLNLPRGARAIDPDFQITVNSGEPITLLAGPGRCEARRGEVR
jgi:hypothetical protein